MRKIKTRKTYSKILNIRINVFENILSQIIAGKPIDYNANKYLERIKPLRVKKTMLDNLIAVISIKDAKKGLITSNLQNQEIKKNIFSVLKRQVSNKIRDLIEFVYENILFYPTYWNGLNEGNYSKMIFKNEFFTSQKNYICPYCDSEEDLSLLNFEIDHLLPKSDFPLLYLNEKNLFPCCATCNHQHYGKGNRWNDKYYNLFKNTLGLKIKFEFEPDFKITGLDSISEDFLKLIRLKNRYNSDAFSGEISTLEKKVFRDLKNKKTNRTFLDSQAKQYFLIKEMYQYYSNKYKTISKKLT